MWFSEYLRRVREPSHRHYVRASELKAAAMDWTDVLAIDEENARARLAAEILARAAEYSTDPRERAFVHQVCGYRATFLNYKRHLTAEGLN